MNIEFKRAHRSYFFILFILLNVLNVILGYILLVSIDELQTVRFQDMFESVYTVYTQFGNLLFSSLIIMQFYIDYKEKNVVFYKTLGFSGIQYYFAKVAMILSATVIGSLVSSTLICLPYGKINMLYIVFLKIESVMVYYTVIISLISYIISNFLIAFFTNIFLWIMGIVISTVSSFAQYFAYFDASTDEYRYLISYLDEDIGLQEFLHHIANNYIYDLIVLVICSVIVILFNRRWLKNGI